MIGFARLAALTERVTIGTSILLLPLYSPAIVAKQMADLDRLTNGRIVLGVGIGGEYEQEFRAVQVPMKERGRRTDEARDVELLHVFAHVQLDERFGVAEHLFRECFRQQSLADTGRAEQQERADRPARVLQVRP